MSKITRKSYKRKKIILGVTLFASVALVSTGFAAWVLSSSAQESGGAGVSAGVVSDQNMEIVLTKATYAGYNGQGESVTVEEAFTKSGDTYVTDAAFVFEPEYGDTHGRVRWDGTNYEVMALTIVGYVNQAQNLGNFNVAASCAELSTAAGSQKNYLATLPACFASGGDSITDFGTLEDVDEDDDGNVDYKRYNFEYTITLEWGSAFGEVNPGEYYDSPAGANVAKNVISETLNDLHDLLDGKTVAITITADPIN